MGLLRAYQPRRHGPIVSHALFADDCIFFARASVRDALCLKLLLKVYCHALGQQINIFKSYFTCSLIMLVHFFFESFECDSFLYTKNKI